MTTHLSDLGASNSDIVVKTLTEATGVICVNDFYPAGLGPKGSAQTPASNATHNYATIADYIAACPAGLQSAFNSFSYALPLVTDQCDWIAWQAATNYGYDNQGHENSCPEILGNGKYVVNRSIIFNHATVSINGRGHRGGTLITYNGSGGTVDSPVPIFDLYNYDEFNYAQGGRSVNTSTSGIGGEIRNVQFAGKAGDMHSASQNVSAYVQGIRLRAFNGFIIADCKFTDTLYDGIYQTGPGLFIVIERCNFYGVHRDGIYFTSFGGNFTTLPTIRQCDFGYVGRYAILIDFLGAITATPRIENNTFEFPFSDSFYQLHPEWWVHGVKAGICLIKCGNLVYTNNYYEGVVDQGVNEASLHLVECQPATIVDDNLENLYITSTDVDQAVSTAGKTYRDGVGGNIAVSGVTKASTAHVSATTHGYSDDTLVRFIVVAGGLNTMTQLLGPTFTVKNATTNAFDLYDATGAAPVDSSAWGVFSGVNTKVMTGTRFLDITDARNHRVGYTGKFGEVTRFNLRALPALGKILVADDTTFDSTTFSSAVDAGFTIWKVPTINASARDGKRVTPLTTKGALYTRSPANLAYRNVSTDSRNYGTYNTYSRSGDYVVNGPTAPTWAAATDYFDTFTVNYLFSVRQLIVPTSGHWNGLVYQCTTAGKSHATTEPPWPTNIGDTVSDGTVTWTCVAGGAYLSSENLRVERLDFGMRRFQVETGTPPTAGSFTVGDQAIYRIPASGGKIGEVCTTGGVPGVWKPFGVIS